MNQLLCHLIGDYVLQTSWMANKKEKEWLPAIIHAGTYMLPFLIFPYLFSLLFSTPSGSAVLVMFLTHLFIDRFSLAKSLCVKMNGFDNPNIPESIRIWIPIIWDNTLHLSINFLCLGLL